MKVEGLSVHPVGAESIVGPLEACALNLPDVRGPRATFAETEFLAKLRRLRTAGDGAALSLGLRRYRVVPF